MLTAALVLFALAALGGAVLLSFAWRGRHAPKGIALIHGAVAALAIVLLAVHALRSTNPPTLSLALFIVAAAGGGYVLYRDLRQGSVPKAIATVHGLIAITAFVLLYLNWSAR
jgi:hypothetical protein